MSTQLTIVQTQLQSWAQIIKESGLKVNDYCCLQHNRSRNTYYYWYGNRYSGCIGCIRIIEIQCRKFTITIPMSSSAEVLSKILEAVNHAE